MATDSLSTVCLVAFMCLSVGCVFCMNLNDSFWDTGPMRPFESRVKRVVGGERTPPFTYPFISGIVKVVNNKFQCNIHCGATIITESHVLTAAHCVFDKGQKYGILSAMHDLSECASGTAHKTKVSNVILHPDFNKNTLQNDIAVLKLERNLNFVGRKAGKICLPSVRTNIQPNSFVKIIGWGSMTPNGANSRVLMKTSVKVVLNEICVNSYKTIPQRHTHQLCTQLQTGPCKGDSGGPLLMEKVGQESYSVVGLISYGSKDCVRNYPSIHTYIHPYISWIQTHASN